MDLAQELKNYLDNMGRLKLFPSKKRYKILSLMYLATKFEKGVTYTEKQINEILDNSHTFNDRCLLRRELFNNKFLGRLKDCSKYWMEEKQPEFEEFKLN
ncbi:MAG TPA: DUF2087 domain-containing protein [Clostridiaceae bacterium]